MMATGACFFHPLSDPLGCSTTGRVLLLFRISRRLLCPSLAVVDLAPRRRLAVHVDGKHTTMHTVLNLCRQNRRTRCVHSRVGRAAGVDSCDAPRPGASVAVPRVRALLRGGARET